MRKWAKISMWTAGALAISAGIIALPFSLSMVGNNQFVFGNFQSYMSNNVMQTLQDKYDVNWQYYATNAEIPTYIKNKTLDAAVASNNMIAQLAVEGEIQQIDWSKFGLRDSDGNLIKSYKQLQSIVSPATWELCVTLGNEAKLPGWQNKTANLLEYCIPYFMQDFVFAYRGPKIDELSDNASFYDIFNYITNTSIPNNRFIKDNSSVMMIKDARTTYDVAKLIEHDRDNPNSTVQINPNPESWLTTENKSNTYAPSISEITNTYKNISNYYSGGKNKNVITFNSDSGIVLNKLASHEIEGAFLYNGDAVYAASGGDVAEGGSNLPVFGDDVKDVNDEFHVIIPKDNFVAMDGIVFNKSLSGTKLDTAYKLAYDISLSGLTEGDNLDDKNSDGQYKYLSVQNFDFVNYTPCYKKLLTFAKNDYFGVTGDDPNGNSQEDIQWKLMNINLGDNNASLNGKVEVPVNNLTESNLNIAFENFLNEV